MAGTDKASAVTVVDVPGTIDACIRFVRMVMDISPALGIAIILLMAFFPFYLVYTWGSVGQKEKAADKRLKEAKANRKRKGKAGGKSK